MVRTGLAALAGIGVGLGAGWGAVRLAAAGPDPPPTRVVAAPEEMPSVAAPPECGPVTDELTQLQAELALTHRLLEDLRAELEGVPAAWSDTTPPEHTPTAFQAVMTEVAVRCPDVKVERVDCSEPPCQAWISHAGDPKLVVNKDATDRLVNCPAWVDAYGTRVDETSFRACAGTGEFGAVVSVRPHEAIPIQSPDELGPLRLRSTTRADRAREEWPCPKP